MQGLGNGRIDPEGMVPSSYLYYYQILQPMELGLLLEDQSPEYIVEQWSRG